MAKRAFSTAGSAFIAVADGLLSAPYMGVLPGSATQVVNISEVYVAGQQSNATIVNALLARSSTKSVTQTALASPFSDGPLNSATAALAAPVKTFSTASTQATRSAATTDGRLNLSLNGFGGIVRWVAYPGEEWVMIGTTDPVELTLSLTTANSGANSNLGAHIIYEPF